MAVGTGKRRVVPLAKRLKRASYASLWQYPNPSTPPKRVILP